MKKYKYVYLINYFFSSNNGVTGIGTDIISMPKPIKHENQFPGLIKDIINFSEDNANISSLTITSYQLIRKALEVYHDEV